MAPQWAREPVTTMINNWIQGGSWDNLSVNPYTSTEKSVSEQFI